MLAHLLEQAVERRPHVTPEGRWQIEGADDLRAQRRVGQLTAVEDDLLVAGADLLNQVAHEGCIRRATHGIAGEAAAVVEKVDGEGADVLLASGQQLLRGQRGNDRGVQAAREQAAQRHVGDDLAVDDVFQQVACMADSLVQRVVVLARLQFPVVAAAQALAADPHDFARHHLAHTGEHRMPRRLDHLQDLAQPVSSHLARYQWVGQQRLGLGAKDHTIRGGEVVERLDAHAVADQQQFLRAQVPDGEGIHAVEPFDEGLAPFYIGAQHHLGVAAGLELVPAPL
ncbi:hypothetical protein D3C85_941950 [compost metagenome]